MVDFKITVTPLGTEGFIPGLGAPDEAMMKGPLVKDNSILKDFIGKGLADIFNKDVLEEAQGFVAIQYQYLYAGMRYNVTVLVALKADSPVLPTKSKADIESLEIAGIAMEITSAEEIGSEKKPAINAWFSPNMIVCLTMNMMNISDEMRQSAFYEIASTMIAISLFLEAAQSIYDSIMKAAKDQSDMYRMQAFEGIMKAIGGVTQMVMSLGSMFGHARETEWNETSQHFTLPSKKGPDGEILRLPDGKIAEPGHHHPITTFVSAQGGAAIGQIFNGIGQAINNFVSAGLVLDKAGWEAYKQIQEVLIQFFEQAMASSIESRKDFEELIAKTLNDLAEITTNVRKAADINPHGTRG